MSTLRGLRIDAMTGKFVARDFEEKGLCGFQYVKDNPDTEWIIQHGRNINLFIYAAFVNRGRELVKVIPEKVEWIDNNTILLDFFEPVSGFVNILYYTEDHLKCPS